MKRAAPSGSPVAARASAIAVSNADHFTRNPVPSSALAPSCGLRAGGERAGAEGGKLSPSRVHGARGGGAGGAAPAAVGATSMAPVGQPGAAERE